MGFDEGIPNDRFLWKYSRQLHWYVSLQLCQQHPMAKMRMLGFFLLVVSQNVLSCPSSAGNISCVLQLRFLRKKKRWKCFCLMSRILNYTKKVLVTLQTGEKPQQVTGCQMEMQGGHINSWRSGINEWGEPEDDNPGFKSKTLLVLHSVT